MLIRHLSVLVKLSIEKLMKETPSEEGRYYLVLKTKTRCTTCLIFSLTSSDS